MEASVSDPTLATVPPGGKACSVRSLIVNRSVFTAVDVSDQTSAPAGADTQVLFAPEGSPLPPSDAELNSKLTPNSFYSISTDNTFRDTNAEEMSVLSLYRAYLSK
ncbi:hypothetical protein E3U43_018896 [Larimichthys crocea]|uniref:Uncharacterized protein n=1 Tax=Larimichthys crocea TaxID=215358 RepID=A0ACD3QWI5_LARCR|nr:hypothetical protein E3U43_018896 [Larimichthys crocea]